MSRDAAGAIRGNCRVVLLRTFDDVKVAETISGPDGTYRIEVSGDPGPCYVVSRVAIDPV